MAKKQLLTEPVLPKDSNDSIINPELYHAIKGKQSKLDTKIKHFDKMPDQKWHQIISFIKSGVRIIGYAIIPFDLVAAAIVLIFSEVIGIIEELV
jgi:hypothetical protein